MPGQSQPFHDTNDIVTRVNLPPSQAEFRGRGKCVVVVVPPLAESKDSEDHVVAAMVVSIERAGSPKVAN